MAKRSSENSKSCSVSNCAREIVGRGYCDGHYSRWRTKGEVFPDIPLQPRNLNRVEYLSKEGYKYIKVPEHPNANNNGWIPEHRKVMSDEIGRALTLEETVHHKNGIRTDNRPENLELRSGQHGSGQTIEDKVEWMLQFLDEYAPALLSGIIRDVDPNKIRYLSELEIEMNRFRGRLLGLLESFGLDAAQERGMKSTLKTLSYDMQAALSSILKD